MDTALSQHSPRTESTSLPARLLMRMARWCQRRSAVHQPADLARTTDEKAYRNWRSKELQQQLNAHFSPDELKGLEVLDFGCGTGELSRLIAGRQPKRLVGVDKSPQAIRRARETPCEGSAREVCPEYLCNEQCTSIPLDCGSVDLICCFDVVEHIPDIAATAREWQRVLRNNGRVWIWWSPWRGPFGHHLESLIPVPWAHLVFDETTIFQAAAKLYDSPDYVPRKWDLDAGTGVKKPNKWRSTTSFFPFLNRLTRSQFERHVRNARLDIVRFEQHGFGGSLPRRLTRLLHPVPYLGEALTSYYVYELAQSPTPE